MFRLCGPGGRRLPGVAEGVQPGQHHNQGPRSETGGVLRASGKGEFTFTHFSKVSFLLVAVIGWKLEVKMIFGSPCQTKVFID